MNEGTVSIKRLIDENRELFYPLTHIDAVRDEDGNTVRDLIGSSGALSAAIVAEDGFFIVDEQLNIGCFVDNNGIHAKNILNYEILND